MAGFVPNFAAAPASAAPATQRAIKAARRTPLRSPKTAAAPRTRTHAGDSNTNTSTPNTPLAHSKPRTAPRPPAVPPVDPQLDPDINSWLDQIGSDADFTESEVSDDTDHQPPHEPHATPHPDGRDSLDAAGRTLFDELGLFFDDPPRKLAPRPSYQERELSYSQQARQHPSRFKKSEGLTGDQQVIRDRFRSEAVALLKSPPHSRRPIAVIRDAFDIVETNGFYPNRMMYNLAFRNLSRSGDVKNTMIMYDLMAERGIKADTYTYSSIFNVCANARNTTAFPKLFEDMEHENVMWNVVLINSALKAYRRAGQIEEMLKLFNNATEKYGVEPDVRTFNCVLDGYSQIGAPDKAKKVFDSIPDPDAYNCSALVGAYAHNGMIDEAKEFVAEMGNLGIKRSVLCNNIILQALAKKRDTGGAIEFYISMVQDDEKSARPNEVTMNTLIDMFAKKGDFVHALEVVTKMIEQKMPVNNVTFSSLLNACAEARESDLAETIFEQMRQTGVELDNVSYGTLLKALVRSDQRRKAQKIVLSVPLGRRTIQMYNVVIHSYSPEGNVGKCNYLTSLARRDGLQPDGTTYSALLYACARAKDGRQARENLNRILEEDIRVRAPTLLSAMFAFLKDSRADFSDDAALLLKFMAKSDIIPDSELEEQLQVVWLQKKNFQAGRDLLVQQVPNLHLILSSGSK